MLTSTFQMISVSAQQSNVATGGNASGSGGTVSYSVGQVVFTTNTGPSNTVAQGVQQPYEISQVVAIEENALFADLLIYPNPTLDQIVLSVQQTEGVSYALCNASGKLIEAHPLMSLLTSIDMSGLSPAAYYITLSGKNSSSRTFKIVKN